MSRIERVELQLEQIFVIPSLIYQSCQLSDTMEKAMACLNIIKPRFYLKTREVQGPKKTRYFCIFCKFDICNKCVSSSCSSHRDHFLGSSSKFSCKSCLHKIK